MTDKKRFSSWVRWLRRHWPTVISVRVRLVPTVEAGLLGACHFMPQEYRAEIVVLDTMNPEQTKDVLLEEWAHLLRFHLHQIGDSEGHDEIYGAISNALKRAWESDT